MRAVLEIESKNPEILKKSIEVDERNTPRLKTSSKVEGGKLVVEVQAEDFTALRAGVTSYLRLAKACMDVENHGSS